MWKLAKAIQHELASSTLTIAASMLDNDKSQKPKYQKQAKQLSAGVAKYKEGSFPTLDEELNYLAMIGHIVLEEVK